MDIAQLGLAIDSAQAVQATNDLNKFAAAADRAESSAIGLQNAGSAAGGGLSRIGAAGADAAYSSKQMTQAVTNASFQIQDFTVQLASGQNALMAFTQQFPQLVGAFGFPGKAGLYGAVIGTAAAIGLTLYSSFMQSVDAAKQFKEAMDSAENSVSAFRTALETSQLPLDRMIEQFGSASPVIRSALADLAAMERIKAFESIDALALSMQALTGYAGQWNAEANSVIQSFLGFTVNSDAARASAFQFNAAMQQLASAQDPVERLKAALDVRDRLDAATGGYKNMNAEQRQMREGLTKIIVHLEAMGVRIDGADGAMDNFRRSAADAQGPVSALVGVTSSLADKAWEAARGMAAFAQKQADAAADAVMSPTTGASVPSGLGNFGLNPLGQGLAPGTSPRPPPRPTLQNDPNWGWSDPAKKGGGGGGGKSLAEDMADRYKTLSEGFASEYALAMQHYARDTETLKWALNTKKISQEQYNDELEQLRIATWGAEWEQTQLQYTMDMESLQSALDNKLIIEEEYYRKRKELMWANLLSEENRSDLATDLSNTAAYFGQLYSLTGSSLDGLLKMQRGFSAAMALINAWEGYTTVLRDPTVPFWMKFAAAGKVLAAGLGAVNAIKGGGGASGGGGATATSSASTQQEPQRVTRIELMGEDWLVNLADAVLSQTYEATKNGRVIIGRA